MRHVFLIGNYDSKKFNHFIEDLYTEFSFKTIQFIQDDVPKNEAGVLFKYKNKILVDNPDYLYVMRYKLCSSFPLTDIISFHKEKEREYFEAQHRTESHYENSFQNTALLTIMGAKIPKDQNKYFGCFAIDPDTSEVLHYAENSEVLLSDLANWGVYFLSVRIFSEYGMTPYSEDGH